MNGSTVDAPGAMVVLRCTQKLLRRLGQAPAEIAPSSSGLLGEWYANVVFVYRKPLVLAISERTLLPLLVPARGLSGLGARLAEELGQVLVALGVAAERIREEQSQMAEFVFARTESRQILGTMNDFNRMLDPRPGQSLTSAALELAEAPCSPIGMESPDRLTVTLFAGCRGGSKMLPSPS